MDESGPKHPTRRAFATGAFAAIVTGTLPTPLEAKTHDKSPSSQRASILNHRVLKSLRLTEKHDWEAFNTWLATGSESAEYRTVLDQFDPETYTSWDKEIANYLLGMQREHYQNDLPFIDLLQDEIALVTYVTNSFKEDQYGKEVQLVARAAHLLALLARQWKKVFSFR